MKKKFKKKELNQSNRSSKRSKSYTPKGMSAKKRYNSIIGLIGASESKRKLKSKSICSNNSDLEELLPRRHQYSDFKNYNDVIAGPRLKKRRS